MEIFLSIVVIIVFIVGYKTLKPIEKQREILAEQIEQERLNEIAVNNKQEHKYNKQMKQTEIMSNELLQLENNCNSKSKKAKNYKNSSIIGIVLSVVCAIVGIWAEDNFWTPFWLFFGGGLLVTSLIIEIISIFLSQLCDMQKLQILSFKVNHNIATTSNNKPKVQEAIKTEERGGNYVGGIKLENYED